MSLHGSYPESCLVAREPVTCQWQIHFPAWRLHMVQATLHLAPPDQWHVTLDNSGLLAQS